VATHPALALPQVCGVGRVEGRGGTVGGAGVSIKAVGEGRAVGDADGVSTCRSSANQKHIQNLCFSCFNHQDEIQ
jgi:hypothetical protein